MQTDGRSRVVIEGIEPEIDAGHYAVKRAIGESLEVQADIFTDGHDRIYAMLLFRQEGQNDWQELPMLPLVNDRWQGQFPLLQEGRYQYTILAWIDRFETWRQDLRKRIAAHQDVRVDLQIGASLVASASERAAGPDREMLQGWAARLKQGELSAEQLQALTEDETLRELVLRYDGRPFAQRYPRELPVFVNRVRARYSSWYELFPRSCSPQPGRHGTLRDCAERLPYIAQLGFDIVYLPPIHPIGTTFRKGRNNATVSEAGDVGSPWAIGGVEGGHKAIHPDLGTVEDFQHLVHRAADLGLEIALDVALQCSPDHPYVREHPDWFRKRPDGSIQYAENPPKKYQDIYPFDFECDDWRAMWAELKSIFDYWIQQGVKVFRVDNPHTKPFGFWEWAIADIKSRHPDVLFLAEAFTRPKIMYRLAKLGFDQSYTYFSWRNTKDELTEYFTHLRRSPVCHFFRPNLWPNTPDILTEYLQTGGRGAFMARFVLAATLGASYGIYGPAFELCYNEPREAGSEEYRDSEKYELKHYDLEAPHSLRALIARVNQIRREHPALQTDAGLEFHDIDNDRLICFSKTADEQSDMILVVVNLDPHYRQSGWVQLPLARWGLAEDQPYMVHDLVGEGRYMWHGPRNYVELDPASCPAHVFRVRRRLRTERDFEYYM